VGTFSNIQRALDTHLNTLSNRPYVAWPNTKFKPQENASFIRPTMLAARSDILTLDDVHLNPGIYQVDVYVPLEKGVNAALTIIDDIKDHFEANRILNSGGTSVFIQSISLGQLQREEAWFRAYLEINYSCYE